MKYTFCWDSVYSFHSLLYNWISGRRSTFIFKFIIITLLISHVIIPSYDTSPRMMARWRKVVRILSLQWLQCHKIIDDVNKLPDDDDVLKEQQLVHSGKAEADRIVIRNLSKIYDDGKVAVDNLSIGIAPGECFGLLGINGEFPSILQLYY